MMKPDEKIALLTAGMGFGLTAIFFGIFSWDTALAGRFFDGQGFPLAQAPFWQALDRWGEYPAGLCTAAGFFVFILSYGHPGLRPWRRSALYFALLGMIGNGLLVNSFFKGWWGRPRPYETTLFGGMWDFLAPLDPGIPGKGRSLASGHAAAGFYFMALYFVLPVARRHLGLALGIMLGLLIGAQRIVEGAHWASDVLLAGFIMLGAAAALAPLLRLEMNAAWFTRNRTALALAAAAALALGLVKPLYENRIYHFQCGQCAPPHRPVDRIIAWQGEDPAGMNLQIEITQGQVSVVWTQSELPNFKIEEEVSGFQLGKARILSQAQALPSGKPHPAGVISFSQKSTGLLWGLQGRYHFEIPAAFAGIARLKAPQSTLNMMLPPEGRPFMLYGRPLAALPAGFTAAPGGAVRQSGQGEAFGLTYDVEQINLTPLDFTEQ
jgi:lipid A 4'-phosphatase